MLTDCEIVDEYRTGQEKEPLRDFHRPMLREARRYWRASGFFSSSMFDALGATVGEFLEGGGRLRLVTSVILSDSDVKAIEEGTRLREEVVRNALENIVAAEFTPPLPPGARLLMGMLAVNRLRLKLAIRDNGALYHEKLGVYLDGNGNCVAFSGSANATGPALLANFESVDVFTSWRDPRRVAAKRRYLARLWRDRVNGLSILDVPEAIRAKLLRAARAEPLPMTVPSMGKSFEGGTGQVAQRPTSGTDRYEYQRLAVEWFVDPEQANGAGLLWMATGTGKTVTACDVLMRLFSDGLIDRVVVVATKRLLEQWDRAMNEPHPAGVRDRLAVWRRRVYWNVSGRRQLGAFRQLGGSGACLFTTYHFLPEVARQLGRRRDLLPRTALLVDEVHNLGAPSIRGQLQEPHRKASDPLASFGYRLGLSATPLSMYDAERNVFLVESFTHCESTCVSSRNTGSAWGAHEDAVRRELEAAGGVYYFGLESAISSGVLAPFDYVPLEYQPTPDEIEERRRVFKVWKARAAAGEATEADVYIQVARVFKSSRGKITAFREYVEGLSPAQRAGLFKGAVAFVEDRAFGMELCKVIQAYEGKYHTFFTGDVAETLSDFREGWLETLVTCHMISEGIDVHSITRVMLFSADRSRRETIQRVGRALRRSIARPDKRALVLDFIYDDGDPHGADIERRNWLQAVAATEAEVQ